MNGILEPWERPVTSTARYLERRFRRIAEAEDIAQVLYLWLLEKGLNRYRQLMAKGTYSEAAARNIVRQDMRRAGEDWCYKERLARTGEPRSVPEDQHYYSYPQLAFLLQQHLDRGWMSPPSQLYAERTTGGKPAHESGDLLAMVADVAKAFEHLSEGDQQLLTRIYGGDLPPSDAIAVEAERWDVTWSAAYNRVRRATGRMRKFLGGARPREEKQ